MTREEILETLQYAGRDTWGIQTVGQADYDRLLDAFMLVQEQRNNWAQNHVAYNLIKYDDEAVRKILGGEM